MRFMSVRHLMFIHAYIINNIVRINKDFHLGLSYSPMEGIKTMLIESTGHSEPKTRECHTPLSNPFVDKT